MGGWRGVRVARLKDEDWNLPKNSDGTVPWETVRVAVLMDIRDELKDLNRKFVCGSEVERRLRGIETELRKARRRPRITARKAAQVLARRRAG